MDQFKPFSDKVCYFINFGSLGDIIAAAPVVKYAIETYHERSDNYLVAIHPNFRFVLHFVPEEKIVYLNRMWDGNPEQYEELKDYHVKVLADIAFAAKPSNMRFHDCTKCHIVDQASWQLLSRIIDLKKLPYVPLEPVPVSDFGIDFDKAVIFCVSYVERTRSWNNSEIQKTAEAVRDLGLVPVFVGKTESENKFQYPGFGENLIDKTSIQQLASIMQKSRAVLGVDSGIMHLAFSTTAPVICGFTKVNPSMRIPHRPYATTISIIPDELPCRFCYSDWNLQNRQGCPRHLDDPECVDYLTAEKFINALKSILGRLACS